MFERIIVNIFRYSREPALGRFLAERYYVTFAYGMSRLSVCLSVRPSVCLSVCLWRCCTLGRDLNF